MTKAAARESVLADEDQTTSRDLVEEGRDLHGGYTAEIPRSLNQNTIRGLKTRLKLINATIECIYKFGYYRTSTILVAKTAGVSRGSMLNQFPSKADLMIAVAQHIAEARADAHVSGLDDALTIEEKFRRLVPILWDELKGPTGVARLELMLASRSDPELSSKFAPLNDTLETSHRRLVWSLTKRLGLTSRELSDAAVQLYAAALRGLSIDLLFPGRQATIEDAAVLLESFMHSLVTHQDEHLKALADRKAL